MTTLSEQQRAETTPYLANGWTHVDRLPERSFEDDNEWEEDEVSYLTLDFGSQLKPDTFQRIGEFQLLALNSNTPFVKIGPQVFRGRYETLVGEELLLSRETAPDESVSHSPLATAAHRVLFEGVILKPRGEDEIADDTISKRQPPLMGSYESKTRKKSISGTFVVDDNDNDDTDNPADGVNMDDGTGNPRTPVTTESKKKGRPEGSKKKPRIPDGAVGREDEAIDGLVPPGEQPAAGESEPKKRGRPVGSKNKLKAPLNPVEEPSETEVDVEMNH